MLEINSIKKWVKLALVVELFLFYIVVLQKMATNLKKLYNAAHAYPLFGFLNILFCGIFIGLLKLPGNWPITSFWS